MNPYLSSMTAAAPTSSEVTLYNEFRFPITALILGGIFTVFGLLIISSGAWGFLPLGIPFFVGGLLMMMRTKAVFTINERRITQGFAVFGIPVKTKSEVINVNHIALNTSLLSSRTSIPFRRVTTFQGMIEP